MLALNRTKSEKGATLFLSTLVDVQPELYSGKILWRANAIRDGIFYKSENLYSDRLSALEVAKNKACEWACYEKKYPAGIANFQSGEIIAANERAIKLIQECPQISWILSTTSFKQDLLISKVEKTLQKIVFEAQLETETVFSFQLYQR